MLMKWEDLEPGDKLKFTKEALDNLGYVWMVREELEIIKIKNFGYNDNDLLIYFVLPKNKIDIDYAIFINKTTGRWNGVQLFEIVSLKED